jgi:uncharacterized protein (DUF885 family)
VALDRRSRVLKRRIAFVAIAIAAVGCGGKKTTPPSPIPVERDASEPKPEDAKGRLDQLVRRHLDAALLASPTTATWLGVHGYDDRIDDVSAEAQAREIARLHDLQDALKTIPDGELDAAHRLDKQLLEREARIGLFELTESRPLERSPIHYLDLAQSAIDEPLARDFAPLPERIRSIDARLLRLRGLFDEARKNLKNPPEAFTRKAIELAQGLRSFLADTLPKAVSAVGDDKLLAEFRAAQGEALRAVDELATWLQKDLLPHSKGDLALGTKLVDRLRATEGIEIPVDKLLAAAEREMNSDEERYEDLAKAVAPGKSLVEAPRVLEDDHPATGELVPTVGAALDQIAAFVRDRKLATLPEPRPKVAEMPPFLWGFTAISSPGPLEPRAHDAYYYVDPVDRGWNKRQREEHLRALNRSQLFLDALHEAIPGHWLQSEAARRAPTTMQRLSQSYAFGEGWAHYAEQMMLDAGFAPGDNKLRLAQLREALLRACRMVAVIRFHLLGAKPEEIVKIFTDDGSLDDYSARREAERVAFDPMVLSHTLGKLAIVKLRDDYKEARGDAFTLGEFHDKLLAHGALPLPLLRKLMLPEAPGSLL